MTIIHSTAIVEPSVQIGNNVVIEPFAVIKGHVVLHDNVTVKSYAYIDGHTTIGEGTTIWPSVMIGNKPQDLKFKGETTYVVIGKNCEIREFTTITSSTGEGTSVKIGDNCLIMSCVHVAHNCVLGNNVIMSNNAMLAGHVSVEDYAVIGGGVGVHQFVRIGCHAMVGGMSGVHFDVLPYTVGKGCPYEIGGINKVGLQRRGFSFQTRQDLAKAFKILYKEGTSLKASLQTLIDQFSHVSEVMYLVDFCQNSKRGISLRFKDHQRDLVTA